MSWIRSIQTDWDEAAWINQKLMVLVVRRNQWVKDDELSFARVVKAIHQQLRTKHVLHQQWAIIRFTILVGYPSNVSAYCQTPLILQTSFVAASGLSRTSLEQSTGEGILTKSSATADGPRDALRRSKSHGQHYCRTRPILSVFFALIVHSELKSVHPGFPVAFIFKHKLGLINK